MLSYGSHSPQRSEKCAEKPPATVDVTEKVTGEASKRTGDTPQGPETEFWSVVHFSFDDYLSVKPLLVYNKLSM